MPVYGDEILAIVEGTLELAEVCVAADNFRAVAVALIPNQGRIIFAADQIRIGEAETDLEIAGGDEGRADFYGNAALPGLGDGSCPGTTITVEVCSCW